MRYLAFSVQAGVDFESAGCFVSLNHPVHPRRRLKSMVLLLGYRGEYPIAQEEREYVLGEGSFMLLFPGQEHYGTGPATAGQSHFWSHFRLEGYRIASEEEAEEARRAGMCVLPEYGRLEDGDKYCILFHQLMDMAEKSGPLIRSEICSACVRIILLNMTEDWAAQKRSISRSRQVTAARVVEWIRLHIREGIDIQQVAAHFQYNSDYLTQVLKAETGMTLGECIHHMRMQEAKNLLLNSDMRVAEIAFAIGFGDEKYFMKAFKKAESVTPSGFRKAYFRRHLNSQ